MENIKVWQWFVIAGPAFLAGCMFTYWICRERIMALKELILPDLPARGELTVDEIAKNLMGTLYDHK